MSNPYAGWLYDVGPGGYDRTHNASVNFVYDLPIFRHTENRFVKTTLGGWEVSGIVTITSGLPINPQLTRRPERQRLAQCQRIVRIRSRSVSYPHTVGEWFSTSSFALPAVGALGDAGHNSLRGPGRDNWNISLFKSFVLSETRGSRFELRVETFNTWNHTEFNQVSNAPRFEQLRTGYVGVRSTHLPAWREDLLLALPRRGPDFGSLRGRRFCSVKSRTRRDKIPPRFFLSDGLAADSKRVH